MISVAFEALFYSSVNLVSIEVYDTQHGGSWDPSMTVVDYSESNSLFVGTGNLEYTTADAGNGLIIAKLGIKGTDEDGFSDLWNDCPSDPYNDIDSNGLCVCEDNCSEHHNPRHEDTFPPEGNSCRDVFEFEGDFGPDGDVDGTDAVKFKHDFCRKNCAEPTPCNGDFECDGDVDGTDAVKFKADLFRKDCPTCPFNCF